MQFVCLVPRNVHSLISAARNTAKAIVDAHLVLLPGAGHHLPEPLWGTIADEVRHNADRAGSSVL